MNFFKKVVEILGRNFITKTILDSLKLPSAIILIIVNILPIIGILFLNWNSYDLLVIYWLENVVVGIYNVARMPFTKIGIQTISSGQTYTRSLGIFSKLFYTFFFIIHFSIFTGVHGIFIKMLAIPQSTFSGISGYQQAAIFFVVLMISHGYSYFANFWFKGEYKTRGIFQQMMSPYKRIVVLQITIIFGAFLSILFPGMIFSIVLVLVKILIDLYTHKKAHTTIIDMSTPDNNISHINYIAPN
jgi:hypothetical protein